MHRIAQQNSGKAPRADLLQVESLCVFYDKFQALHDVDLNVGEGETVSIIGANGAGKSSFLKAIVGQIGRLSGRVRLQGEDLTGLATRRIVAAGVALVPEGRRLFPSLTVKENLDIGWRLGRRGDIDIEQIYAWFPVLHERRDQLARSLSGGQQQMAALGRALLANPRLLLCDEISLGLAPRIVDQLYDIIGVIRGRGIGIILVEQDIGRALAVADRFYCLLEGRVSLSGSPRNTTRDLITQSYFGT